MLPCLVDFSPLRAHLDPAYMMQTDVMSAFCAHSSAQPPAHYLRDGYTLLLQASSQGVGQVDKEWRRAKCAKLRAGDK